MVAKTAMATGSAALLLAGAGIAAHAQTPKATIMPTDPAALEFQQAVGYSDAVVHGDTIYMAGIIAMPQPGDDGLEPAYERAFVQMGAVLQRSGATWDDVLVFDTFHVGDMNAQLDPLVAVKNRYIKAPFPTWTAIGVTQLYEPGAVTEIRLTARRQSATPE